MLGPLFICTGPGPMARLFSMAGGAMPDLFGGADLNQTLSMGSGPSSYGLVSWLCPTAQIWGVLLLAGPH